MTNKRNQLTHNQEQQVERLIEQKVSEAIVQSEYAASYQGITPTASESERLERICPGFVNRCMGLAENSLKYSHEATDKRNDLVFTATIITRVLAFLIVLLTVGGYILLAWVGKDTQAYVSLFTGVALILWAFWGNKPKTGKASNKKK